MKNIAVMIVVKKGHVLMHRRKYDPIGKFDFPGGFVNAGETIHNAAIRETKEETGFDIALIAKFGQYLHPDSGKTVHVFSGIITGGNILSETNEGFPCWQSIRCLKKDNVAFGHNLEFFNDFLRKNHCGYLVVK